MRLETLLVHAGHTPDPATGAVSPPIHLSTNFAREHRKASDGWQPRERIYSRPFRIRESRYSAVRMPDWAAPSMKPWKL